MMEEQLISEHGIDLTAEVILKAYIRIALSDLIEDVEKCKPSERLKALDFLAQYLQIIPTQEAEEEKTPPLTIVYDYGESEN